MKEKQARWKPLIFSVLWSALFAVLIAVYISLVQNKGNFEIVRADHFGIHKWIIFLIPGIFLVISFLKWLGRERLFRYRYIFAGGIFVLCVLFEISGSSIGIFLDYFGMDQQNTVLGISRPIRSDEWATLTPMTWSQYMDPQGAFSYFSSVIRGGNTDVFLVYGLPVASPLILYKPFMIGYLFLPVAKGMAFFWCGRVIVLFMASFEFGRLLTKDDRKLALAYAFMISFAPCVQWWLAINGFVEMLVFFQLSIVCFNRFLLTHKTGLRFVLSGVITICAGGYILTMYPAWMIPLAYVLLGCIIALLIIRIKERKIRRLAAFDYLSISFWLLVLIGSLIYVFFTSKDTITALMSTVYPGKRISTGGGLSFQFINYFTDLWFAIRDSVPRWNTCESSYFLCLFPVGYYLFVRNWIRTKKADPLSVSLVVTSVFIIIYCVTGIPEIVAKLTLMSKTTSNRAYVIAGLANVLLLIREMSKENVPEIKNRFSSVIVVVSGMVLSVAGIIIVSNENPGYYSPLMLSVTGIIFTMLFAGAIYSYGRMRHAWIAVVIVVSLFSSFLVNPVRAGESDVQSIQELQIAESVAQKDPDAIWAIEGMGYPMNNALLLKGIRTINSTNIYPDVEKWRLIDEDGKYDGVYNRYAHISIVYTEDEQRDRFELISEDLFQINMSLAVMKKLGIKYIFTQNDFSSVNGFNLMMTAGNFKIYAIY